MGGKRISVNARWDYGKWRTARYCEAHHQGILNNVKSVRFAAAGCVGQPRLWSLGRVLLVMKNIGIVRVCLFGHGDCECSDSLR